MYASTAITLALCALSMASPEPATTNKPPTPKFVVIPNVQNYGLNIPDDQKTATAEACGVQAVALNFRSAQWNHKTTGCTLFKGIGAPQKMLVPKKAMMDFTPECQLTAPVLKSNTPPMNATQLAAFSDGCLLVTNDVGTGQYRCCKFEPQPEASLIFVIQ